MNLFKLKYLNLFIGGAFLLSSCSKQLDVTPQVTPTETSFWKSEADALKGVNAMYDQFDGEEFYGRGFMWYINASDDMVTGRSNATADNIKNFASTVPNASYLNDQWSMRYTVIKRANDVIRNVPRIGFSDETLKNRYIGEAYFLRALMYFQLTYNYGNDKAGVPIVRESDSLATAAIPRAASAAVNYAMIDSDFVKAAALLPYFDTYSSEDYGRPHKTAAWSYLSKSFLYQKDWAHAENYADSVILSGKHALLANFADVFTTANNWTSEYIWSAYSSGSVTGGWGSILPGIMLENKGWGKYNGWGYFMPTKELYDTYEDGDTRRAATILKPGDIFQFWGVSTVYSSDNSTSGYQFNKYMEPFSHSNPTGTYVSTNGDHPTTSLNPPLLRYAEIILIKAEAMLMQGQNADKYINMIRARAGLKDVVNADISVLKHERRCEFAGEWADRHRDLVRWGDAKAAYALPLHGVTGTVIWPARNYDADIDNVWPVPQSEITTTGGVITQNSGW
ncbi:RagB/SusD family nutrient uptake outer membrane protein [Rhizosphaericola mali]|uniref:RagB/SusD family nutrient uptake outer membrane protein n=1 Tax=Rhizosphaericola mali TaxID=2545455 RepID=A0A5P2G1Y7_9BACT|nr:RagB/SusD family nutrient uptake outer membrane protein [Rhizosphaericola mali]QES89826.1 RagB/SusD family nutrient uptake outer membrane protein [Rhizosphaericola mali]